MIRLKRVLVIVVGLLTWWALALFVWLRYGGVATR